MPGGWLFFLFLLNSDIFSDISLEFPFSNFKIADNITLFVKIARFSITIIY